MFDPYKRLNPYHMNRMGNVIRLNADGTTTVMGRKARVIALAFTNITTGIIVASAAYQAYQAGKEKGRTEAINEPDPDEFGHTPFCMGQNR
jgi:hypothetical protein